MFARHPPCQHSVPGTSGRLGGGFQAWLPCPATGHPQPSLRGFSVLASSRADKRSAADVLDAPGRRALLRTSSDLQTVPGIGRVNEARLLSKGLTSVELLTEVFIERKKRNKAEMIAYLQVQRLNCA